MKVPLSWLKDFVDIPVTPEELAQRLTFSGLEVGEIQYIGVDGSALPWDPDKVLVANILEVKPHPNADRLVLVDVDYGGSAPHTVVTGAPNLFSYKGQGPLQHPLKSVFAREGVQLYDGHKDGWVITMLQGRPVRGVMSDAMLCSEKELGISDDHEGIVFLEDAAPVGTPLRDYLGEVVLDIDLTPNLARCLSMVGVAREVAALLDVPLRLPDPQVQMDGPRIGGHAHVTVEDQALCPRFTATLIEGITIGESPKWMQRRLIHAGMRPINNIVDISNYVMLEWGQPTHAFDADRVKDQHLVVRLARPGERLVTLDGKDRDLGSVREGGPPPLMVCDPDGPLSIAGIMGGEDSEVHNTTTRVLLEAAIWEPTQIRRTAQAFKLPSEASRRFERGVDINLPPIAQNRCLELMRTLAGGTVYQGMVDAYPETWQPLVLDLPPREVTRIVGITLSAQEIAELLQRLEFGCEVVGTAPDEFVRVTVPSFRQDVTLLADLCEEVARIYGYDRIPSTRMADELPPSAAHPELDVEQRLRDVLVGAGLEEAITYSLTNMATVEKTSPTEAMSERYLRLSNPVSPEREYLRRSLLPNLLEALAANLRERERVRLFELGRVFLPLTHPGAAGEWLPNEPRRLAIGLAGSRDVLNWNGTESDLFDFFDLKGVIELVLTRLGLSTTATFAPLTDDERFHPGRAAVVLLEKPVDSVAATRSSAQGNGERGRAEVLREPVGVFGELHPAVCERLGIELPRVVAAELDLDTLIALVQPATYTTISRYPATLQDLAIVAAQDVSATRIGEVIRRGAGELLESLTLFDVYSGPQVGEGKRSVAYRLAFRAPDRTLSDEALAKIRTKIIKLLERELEATIRG